MSLRPSLQILLLLVCLLPATGCLPLPPAGPAAVLHGEIVWEGAVRIAGDVVLAPGAHLTIRPGTVVRFASPSERPGEYREHPYFPGSELIVRGRITAIGTPAAPIVFRAAGESAPAGSWGALNLEDGAEAEFAFCVFRQADSAVHSRNARVAVRESLFEDNLVALRFHSSDILVEHNLLRGNATGLRFHFGSPVVRANRFEGNRVNLFVTAHPSGYRFEGNRFGTALDYQVVLGEEVPEDVRLPGNFWDDAFGGTLPAERLFDGRRAAYLGQVLVEPVLTDPPAGAGPSWTR